MKDRRGETRWELPYRSPLPAGPAARRRAKILRVAAYVLAATAALVPVAQFQRGTMRAADRAEAFDRKHPDWTRGDASAGGPRRPSGHKGAIGRWRVAVRQLWAGWNIYELLPVEGNAGASRPAGGGDEPARFGRVYMHPNTLLTVLLLTPFAYLPAWAAAISFNALKLLVLAAAVWMSARLACHRAPGGSASGERRPVDWVVALGLLWVLVPVIGDIQHGNTNVFSLGAIVLHLWLYRRGRDVLAGPALAGAICLKMTPALFLLYWAWQRNWRLVASAAVSLAVLGAAVPAAALGPRRYAELTRSWVDNVIAPGLLRGGWYPQHINQSLSGVVSRYFLAGRNGDIHWGPDDHPHYEVFARKMAEDPSAPKDRWITVVELPESSARWLLRAARAAVLVLMAWSIGWRRLPRADGRRALHYGLVLLGMMLLNQRTWQHHAAVLVLAGVAIWQAVAFGRVSRRARRWAFGLTIAAGLCIWLPRGELFGLLARAAGRGERGEAWADLAKAFGPTFCYFVLLFAAAAVLAVAARRAGDPYAPTRQTLTAA